MAAVLAQNPVEADQAAGPVLVVDDDPDIVQLVQEVLEEEGFRVVSAGDGQEALAQAKAHPPALVVLDLLLPDQEGDAVAGELRSLCGPALPIVLISATGRARETARHLGLFAYLEKPFQVETLVALVTRGTQLAPPRPPSPEAAAVARAAEKVLTALRQAGIHSSIAEHLGIFVPPRPD